jgi:hypothetical protein
MPLINNFGQILGFHFQLPVEIQRATWHDKKTQESAYGTVQRKEERERD